MLPPKWQGQHIDGAPISWTINGNHVTFAKNDRGLIDNLIAAMRYTNTEDRMEIVQHVDWTPSARELDFWYYDGDGLGGWST